MSPSVITLHSLSSVNERLINSLLEQHDPPLQINFEVSSIPLNSFSSQKFLAQVIMSKNIGIKSVCPPTQHDLSITRRTCEQEDLELVLDSYRRQFEQTYREKLSRKIMQSLEQGLVDCCKSGADFLSISDRDSIIAGLVIDEIKKGVYTGGHLLAWAWISPDVRGAERVKARQALKASLTSYAPTTIYAGIPSFNERSLNLAKTLGLQVE